jgi:glycosyltransferase involved in cell wall biosynthesis
MVKRVAHLSTAHGRRETRIHLKQCNSLASVGYEVFYLVADGLGNELVGQVQVLDIGKAKGRFKRMLVQPWRMLLLARKLNASVYHFHDPELLLIALFLGLKKAAVIYDSHEDVPRSLLGRDWINPYIRTSLSKVFETFEDFVSSRISGVVGATSTITSRFSRLNPMTETINNFPLKSEIDLEITSPKKSATVCYLGGISRIRGIREIISALGYLDIKLILAGPFESEEAKMEVSALPGWDKVDYRGNVSRAEVWEIMAESVAGLVLYHPEPNHVNAQPNKMFEYMAASLPVVASNFPLWRKIIESNNFGICVDPLDPKEIADAINKLVGDRKLASEMGEKGRKAVIDHYSWGSEEKKLFDFYSRIIPK